MPYTIMKRIVTDMAVVYPKADRVLILDADLLLFDSQPAIQHKNYNEIFMRIRLSRWMQRLWTLQEGILASDLWLQFKDGPQRFHDLRDTMENLVNSDALSPVDVVYPTVVFAFDRILRFPRGQDVQKRQINSLYNLLLYRSTKHSEDEAILLGSIMLLSKDDRVKIQQPQAGHVRLQQYIGAVGSCSREIIFSRGARMSEEGWRWAPMTFLPIDLKSQLQINEQAKIEKLDPAGDGLLVRGPRFQIKSDNRKLPYPIMLAASGLTKYVIWNMPGLLAPVPSWDALKLQEVKQLGLLLNNSIAKGNLQMQLGILVDLQHSGVGNINVTDDTQATKVKAKYVGRVIVKRQDVDTPAHSFLQASEVSDDDWWVLC